MKEATADDLSRVKLPETNAKILDTGTACGVNGLHVTGLSSGTFQSPNYPNNYPNDAFCKWVIVAPLPTQVVEVTFVVFKLDSISVDYFIVNYQSSEQKYLSGYRTGEKITSSGQKFTLVFKSDSFKQETGFQAIFTVFPPIKSDVTDVTDDWPKFYYPLKALRKCNRRRKYWRNFLHIHPKQFKKYLQFYKCKKFQKNRNQFRKNHPGICRNLISKYKKQFPSPLRPGHPLYRDDC
jgi:hypothetical protein